MITYLSIISISVVVVLSLELSHVAGSQVPRIRGIPLDKVSLYNADKFFSCLDGSKKVPFNQVNDDYCDCADGSDEPGTAACTNGFFYCQNAGFEAKYVMSSRVNDGVCDCCDGSDEYDEKVKCTNDCSKLGQEARAEADKKAALYKEGSLIREQMIERGKQLENEIREKLNKIRSDYKEAESIKNEKEDIKNKMEEKESLILEKYKKIETLAKIPEMPAVESKEVDAKEYFESLDVDSSGTIEVSEITSKMIFDRDGNGVVSDEEVAYFLGNQDRPNLEEFIYKSWDNIKPFAMKEQGLFSHPHEGEAEHDEEETAKSPDHDENEEHDEHADLPDDDEDDEAHDGDSPDEADKEPEPEVKYTEEEEAVINETNESRTEFQKAEKTLVDLQNEMRSHEQKIERDYGDDPVFASLDGECFRYTDLEYIYSLCMYGRATQSSKMGGGEVLLGNWNDWTGPDNNRYSKMKYTNGLTCWNGPARSVDVTLLCGKENQLIGVSEPSRCEYAMVFTTPALCHVPTDFSQTHDEL